MRSDEWFDAQQMARAHPEMFDAPTKEMLDAIKPGEPIVVARAPAGVRFWVYVVAVDGDILTITDDNGYIPGDEPKTQMQIEKRFVCMCAPP